MKDSAEEHLGTKVNECVITVPANFNDAQRQATKDAGDIAGLKVLRVINEPTAAAIAYGYQEAKQSNNKHVLVFDFGGGTFDVTIVKVEDNKYQVIATGGNDHLGGEDLDNALVVFVAQKFEEETGQDITK